MQAALEVPRNLNIVRVTADKTHYIRGFSIILCPPNTGRKRVMDPVPSLYRYSHSLAQARLLSPR